jgi:hypothetical protein
MDFDEKYIFGTVMNYTLSSKNLESKICPIFFVKLGSKVEIC